MNDRNRMQLEGLIREHRFEHALSYLLEHTRQGIRCTKAGEANDGRLGGSRIGGDPDLPARIDWPATSEGVPMTFLVQLNLQELAAANESLLLPDRGMLYFSSAWTSRLTISSTASSMCRRRSLLPLRAALRPGRPRLEGAFRAYRLEPRATLEPPNFAYADTEQVENDTADYEDYEEFVWSVTNSQNGDVALLFGYPDGQHGDAEYEAALRILTGEHYDYNTDHALRRIAAHLGGNEEKAKQEIRDTLLLLEIDSDDDVGFCWWDAGALQFFIRKADLQAGRFDRTYCSLYSS
ncbi:YwqG family protein [Paenibacillus sp. JTLBN-2024]